jgi:serine protease Do
MDVFKLFVAIIFLGIASTASAALYKWVDDNGQLHYSDKPGGHAKGKSAPRVKVVTVHDGFVIKDVAQQYPTRFSGKGRSRGVLFSNFHLRLPVSEGHRIKIGRFSRGPQCEVAGIYYWNAQDVPMGDEGMGKLVSEVFTHYGYHYSHSQASSPLILSATITTLKVDTCQSTSQRRKTRDAAYVKLEWTLRDAAHNTLVYKATTEGSMDRRGYTPRTDGLIATLDEAISVAIVNLLADQEFVAKLSAQPIKAQDIRMSATAPVIIHYGKREGEFRNQVQALEALAVTVKTEGGHGSGVLLDKHGYVLTNAHVVGDASYVGISIEQRELRAKVIRKQPARDVALVKIVDESLIPQTVPLRAAKQSPLPGDEIYVIGTPLDVTLSETITKGIVSAKRTIDGLPYLQTDAAINPGNSGGPAFDAKGELVAIAVASLITSTGASLNINYLIPIDEAMKSLNIVALD